MSQGNAKIDEMIKAVLDVCFSDPENPMTIGEARRMFFDFADQSNCLYFQKHRILEQGYLLRVEELKATHMKPLHLPAPSFTLQVEMHISLIQNTIMDEDITSVDFSGTIMVGNMNPPNCTSCVF